MSDVTPAQIFEDMSAKLTANPESVKGVDAIYQFKVVGDDGGEWFADLKGETPNVAAGTRDDATCTITVASKDFVDIKTGKLSGQMAFMTGKLKIAGNMAQAMKLQKLLA
ncbi:SCP2 sterol-binding domain-containing protein [bacterium]|nr:SCP2 sterol-binding domain-containing protein [bacterium]